MESAAHRDHRGAVLARARDGKVQPSDIEGSTFTTSNLGMYGIEHFAAIINPPEVAILATGAVQEVAVVRNGQVVPGTIMRATLSADHRVTDGAEGAPLPHCPPGVPGHLRRTRRIVVHEWIRMNIARQAPLTGLR